MVSFLVASAATAAFGDPLARPESADARGNLDRGNKLYNVGSFEEAIKEYKAGALIEPAPVFDYNLGQSNRQLGRYREALWHYDRFLNKGQPGGELRDAVVAFMAEMRAHLENKAQTMRPTDPAPTSMQQVPAPVQVDSQHGAVTDQRTDPWYRDKFAWGISGAGLVALGIGIGFLVDGARLQDEASSTSMQQEHDQLKEKAQTRTLVGAIVGVGGLGLLATGVIKFVLHDATPQHLTAWNIGVSGDGLTVFGRF